MEMIYEPFHNYLENDVSHERERERERDRERERGGMILCYRCVDLFLPLCNFYVQEEG
jgi:hypothetical protein